VAHFNASTYKINSDAIHKTLEHLVVFFTLL
jgi:hypothetical protein